MWRRSNLRCNGMVSTLSFGPVGQLATFQKHDSGKSRKHNRKHQLSSETTEAGTFPKISKRPGEWTEVVKKGGKFATPLHQLGVRKEAKSRSQICSRSGKAVSSRSPS